MRSRSPRIMEGTVIPIINHVQANIGAALARLRADRTDNKVNTDTFQEYYSYEKIVGYVTPSLFIIGRNVQFRKSLGQNHINALVNVQVSALVDEKDIAQLTYKCWRYHDALHDVLDQAQILDDSGAIKNIIRVVGADFGDAVSNKTNSTSPFRMEVMLTLEVEHIEQE